MPEGITAAGQRPVPGRLRGTLRVKPSKPYPDFPLFPHATGRWCKKINGKFAFFGPWENPHGALERYLAERDALYAGFVPRANGEMRSPHGTRRTAVGALPPASRRAGTGEEATLRFVVNHFLTAKQRKLDAGEITQRAFADYYRTAEYLLKALGKDRRIDDLTPEDFGMLRAALGKDRGPVTLAIHIQKVRSIFKHAYEARLIDQPVRFGTEFQKPSARIMRLARRAKGEKLFEPPEIKMLLEAAGVQMRAMIFLGLNAGLGNTDVARLPRSALDLTNDVLAYPRSKTGIERRAVLWPETVEALQAALAVRPTPKAAEAKGLVFVTRTGKPWVRIKAPGARSAGRTKAVLVDAVNLEFTKLVKALGLARSGRAFYALRHTFRTIADEVNDRPAVDLIMGHQDGRDIATHYVERISDERLRKVAEHVRGWALLTPSSGMKLP